MKVWEKMLLYPIGLCYWIADSAKKTGNFIGRKAKPAIAMLVAVTMMLSLMPITAFAATDPSVLVGGVEMYSASGATYYVNGATTAVTTEPNNWNAKYENGILTIKNLSVVGAADYKYKYAGIYATTALTIDAQGANSVTGADCSGVTYGIYIAGALTIQGDGALSVTGGTATSGSSFGISTTNGNNISITENVVVNATGGTAGTTNGSIGIDCGGTLLIEGNATVNATGGSAGVTRGIYSDDVRVTGGVTVATGGTASGSALTSYGISISSFGDATVTTTGGVLVARAGSGTTTKAINGTLTTNGTKLAGQVVGSTFTGSPAEFNENATALAIVPESYTVKNTPLTGTNQTEYTIDTNTAVVTPGTSGNGTPLVLTEAGSTVTLNSDLVLINLLGEWVTPAFSFSGSSASPAKVTGSGTLTAIGAAKSDGKSYGISASGNSYLTVDGVDVIAIGGTASNKSYGIGANANVTVSNGGSVIAIGGAMTNDDADSYGIGSYNLSVSDTGEITAIGGAVGDSAFSYGISTYDATVSGTAKVTAVGGNGGSMSASYGVGCPNTANVPVTVSGGTLNAVAGKTDGNSYGINNTAGTITVGNSSTGGTVNAVGGPAASFSAGIYGGTVKVRRGSLNAVGGFTDYVGYGIRLSNALNVSGGTVDAAGVDYGIDGQYGQGVTISGGTVTAVGGSVGLISSSSSSLAGGSFTGGEMAVFCQNGVNALLASGYSYFAGDNHLTPADSDTTVGSAYQTVTVKTSPHTHSYTYSANGYVITESCTCGHKETATLELDTTVSAVYTGSAINPLKVTYSSGWAGDQNAAISYSNNTNAGTASGSVTIGGATATKSFAITKKSAEAPAAPTAQNSITYGAELSEVGLTAGWTWADGNTIPTVNNSGYTAYYTPADVTNLDWTAVDGWNASAGRVERTVAVTVNKSAPTYTAPTGLTATYGDTLANVSLPSGWTWKTPSASVGNAGVNSFKAVYTPSDTDNFNAAEVDVSVTVGKANSSYTAPTAKELVYNGSAQTLVNAGSTTTGAMQYALGSITEPTGSWSATLPQGQNAGTYYIWYKVVGDDNHNDVAPACIAVTIAKKQIAKPAADNSTFTYNGSYQTYAMNGDPAFKIDNNMQKNAGSYTVTVTLQDTANYEWTDGTTAVLEYTFKIEQKEIGISWSNTALTYNGAAQQPTATATGVVAGEQIALVLGAPATNAGSYTATVHSIDGATAQNYKLPTNKSTSFTIEQQALTILWGNGTFTYDSTEKFPTFNVEGIWNADDVQFTKEGAQTNAGEYTAEISGLTGTAADNYKLTGTLTKDFVINKADQAAPAVNKVDETISGKNDGKITDVTANMEYRAEGEDRYTAITGETVENLADGKYYVRVKGDSNHNPSADTAVVIGAGRMLTVTVPQNQVGYTMITTTPEVEYFGSIRVEFKLHDGYSMTDSFQICNGTDPVGFSLMGDTYVYGLNFVNSDFNFTVSGVADITAPLAQIDIKNNKWTSFWNGVTFGLFFNETQDVTVTAADTGSGMNSIQYYLAGGELELDEVRAITDWVDYNGTFKIDPNNRYVVYAKVTDNAGNVSYLNSDGVVLDQTVPVLVGIENNGSYYGDQCFKALDDYLDALKVDGVDVTDEMNADNEYTIVADNAEHIVTATDKAGNATEYKITVFKNYTVTYKVDGNTVSTQTVGHGKDATALTIPEKEGYTQTAPAWDKDGKNITADTEINAVYTINKYTVTYKADGNVVGTVEVEHGKDAAAPAIPEKEGYTKTAPVWDKDGKNITADTEINAVYTINEYTITFMDENGVYKTLTYKHGEAVTMPEVPTKDGYTVTWETTIDKATVDATVKAVYTENVVSDSPQTGDNSNMFLWIALLFISGGAVITLTVVDRKRRMASKR